MYYLVTGDDDFMEKMGLELLLEIARLWYDLGNFYDGKFELHCVTGPDEYTCVVNNNYYTNVSAKYDLVWAVKYFRLFESKGLAGKAREATRISDGELDGFLAASDAMYLPYDAKLGITPQDDSFLSKKVWDLAATPVEDFPLLMHYHPLTLYRYQVCKQADTVLAHFLYEDEVSRDVMERSFRYYEKLTTHDSSLSTCIFSIMASRLGFETEHMIISAIRWRSIYTIHMAIRKTASIRRTWGELSGYPFRVRRVADQRRRCLPVSFGSSCMEGIPIYFEISRTEGAYRGRRRAGERTVACSGRACFMACQHIHLWKSDGYVYE
jgi:hypothetical protein